MRTKNAMTSVKETQLFITSLVKAIDRQEKVILSLISGSNKNLQRIKINKGKMISVIKNYFTTENKYAPVKVVAKIKKPVKLQLAPVVQSNRASHHDMATIFKLGLTEIGRPARVNEIVDRLAHMKTDIILKYSKNRIKFRQSLYNVASTLSRDGVIDRKPVDNKSYEYGLPGFFKKTVKVSSHKEHQLV